MRNTLLPLAMPGLSLFLRKRHGKAAFVFCLQGATLAVLLMAWRMGTFQVTASSLYGKVGLAIIGFALLCARLGSVWSAWKPEGDRYGESYWTMVGRRFGRDAKSHTGGGVLLVLAFVALLVPFVTSDPLWMDFSATLQAPSSTHVFGTDMYGRDIFSRIVHGSRISLGIGLAATALNMLLGTFLGVVSGYFGGLADAIIMRLLEILNSIPFLMLAILIMAVFGSSTGMLILVLSVFALQPARIIRSQILELRGSDYIRAAEALGASQSRIILRHVLPNAMSSLFVVATIRLGQNIISLAGLSFLGLGITPPTPSWGAMLQEGRALILQAPWIGFFPGAAIFITVLSFNLLGDALRDALDPRLKI